MDARTFLENFGAIADAPGGVERLRKLILDLAIRGQLVPQRATDEPARSRLAGSTVRNRCDVADQLTPLPTGWEPVGLLDLGKWAIGSGFPKKYQGESSRQYMFCKVSDMNLPGNERFINTTVNTIDEHARAEMRAKVHPAGTVVFPKIGGAIATNKRRILIAPTAIDNNCLGITPTIPGGREWIWLVLTAVDLSAYQSGTSVPALSQGVLEREIRIGLPPLAEQERIFSKVDELMQLSDDLEARQQARQHVNTRLRASSLDALTTAETDDDLHIAWSRIHANWEALTDHPDSIEALRETILQLAVRGLLVERDPSPAATAEDLMEATKRRRRELSEARGLRRPKELRSLSELPKPFDLPAGWAWARFTELGELARGRSQHRPRNDPALYTDGTIPLVQTGDVARADGQIDTWSALYNQRGVEQSRLWPAGTLCITIAANIADSALLRFDACFPDSVVGFVPFEPIPDARYFEYVMRTAQAHLEQFAPSTAQKNINLAILDELLIPLPPLAEMIRIVDKVEALLTLCDSLGSRLSERDKASDMLAKSLLGAA